MTLLSRSVACNSPLQSFRRSSKSLVLTFLNESREFSNVLSRNNSAVLREESCIQSSGRGIPGAWRVLSRVETLHVFGAELEVEHIRVLLDSAMSNALRQNDKAFLQAPTEQNLRRCLVVSGCERLEQRVISTCGTNKRRVCLKDDTALCAPLNDIGTSEPRVKLDLVDRENAGVI